LHVGGHEFVPSGNRREWQAHRTLSSRSARENRRFILQLLSTLPPWKNRFFEIRLHPARLREKGQQYWIVDPDGSKIGATVENVFTQTIDSEVTLSAVLPA
jgi:hypothetical protein